jgi:hypothetical protein
MKSPAESLFIAKPNVARNPMGPYSKKRCMSENKTWGNQITSFIIKRVLLIMRDRRS